MRKFTKHYVHMLRYVSLILGIIFLKDGYGTILSAISFCALSIALDILIKKTSFKLNNISIFFYNTLIVTAIFGGGGLDLYKKFYWWDIMVHFISGIATFYIGKYICFKFKIKKKYHAFIILLFVMSTALSWEIIEFLWDGTFKSNLQEWQSMAHEPFATLVKERGHGLVDTMTDMIMALIGYLASLIVYLKKERS